MKSWKKYAGFYVFVCAAAICGALLLSRAGTAAGTVAAARELPPVVVIDAGHGGEDGGARSCTGVQESGINLEIALRVNDLMHFLGMQTRMIRTTDCAVYTEGARTIAEKKVSDIHNRVRMVEETPGALLASASIRTTSRRENTAARRCFMPRRTAAGSWRSRRSGILRHRWTRTTTGNARPRRRFICLSM